MKNIGRYLLILIAVLALWNTIVIKPLKIFAVVLHELGHTAMAFVFGGGIKAFKVNLNESGYALVQSKGWFSSFVIANGGYLGSVLFALLILYLRRTRVKPFILGTTAILFLGIALRFSGFSFMLLYSVIFAVAVILLYMLQNEKVNDWIIDIIGISSLAYAVYDTFVDTILLRINLKLHIISGWGKTPVTDAMQLQKLTHIPDYIWGTLWLVIALMSVYLVLFRSSGSSRSSRASKSRY